MFNNINLINLIGINAIRFTNPKYLILQNILSIKTTI
jgi:hypothetical protein